jgi:hypothetical protein
MLHFKLQDNITLFGWGSCVIKLTVARLGLQPEDVCSAQVADRICGLPVLLSGGEPVTVSAV